MRTHRYRIYVAAALIVAGALVVAALVSRSNGTPKVVTTTSVLASVVEDLGSPHIQSATLVPAGSCPGHFDIKVQHLRLLEESGTLLAHGFEEYLPDIQRSVSNPDFAVTALPIEKSWLTGDGMEQLYRNVADELGTMRPEYREQVRRNLKSALERMEETDRQVRMIAERGGFAGMKVICNSHMVGMAEHLGFEVTAHYGRREELTSGGITALIDRSRSDGVELVIDNMQAGADTGKVFSEALGIPHVAVSNFPGVLPGADTLGATLLANTARIAERLKAQPNSSQQVR